MIYRVVFMGTPAFALPCLERLLEGPYSIEAVYTQPDRPSGRGRKLSPPPVKEFALRKGLPLFQPDTLKSAETAAQFAALKADVTVVAAYGKLIPAPILELPAHGCVNLHPSLLPRYRGASPVASAILAGDRETGVTVMLLDEGMDSGPVLAQMREPILERDTTATLTARLAQKGADLMAEALPLWLEGRITPQPQDESLAVYTSMLAKKEGEIDWERSAEEIARQVRALNPWPGSYARWQSLQVKITEAFALPGGEGRAGKVIELPPAAGAVAGVETPAGILALVRVQMQGKKEVGAEEFIRGQRMFVGSTLS